MGRFCMRKVHADGPSRETPLLQRDPEVVFWPSGVLEAWGTQAKRPHMFRKIVVVWPCRLRRQGQKTTVFLKMCGFWPWYPRPPKKDLAKKPRRDPFEPLLGENNKLTRMPIAKFDLSCTPKPEKIPQSAKAQATDLAGQPVLNETVLGPPVPNLLGVCAKPVIPNPDFASLRPAKCGSGPPATHKPRAISVPVVQERFRSRPVDQPYQRSGLQNKFNLF